ncbi:MAG: PKD domain-containing protein [Bacteroidota bacterium]
MTYLKSYVILLSIVLLSSALFSQNASRVKPSQTPWKVIPFERKAFIENKGQFENDLPADKKAFNYCVDKGYQVFFYNNALSYRFTKYVKSKAPIFYMFETEAKREERQHKFKTEIQYIEVKWLNSNPNASIVVENKQSTYYSYVINNGNEKPTTVMCDGYSKLIYKDLYPGIDVEYVFHPENGLKYNLLIHPGADISKVQMQYIGAANIALKNGNIHIPSLAGDIIDHAPVTFYAANKEQINSSFTIKNNIISFNIQSYDNSKEIIIDPWTVVPGYTPSLAYDNGTDDNGNIYIYGGSQNNFVVEKYSSTGGAALWSLGSSGIDQMYYGDMLVENNGNFYLSEGFVSSGAHTYKFATSSTQTWQSTISSDYQEHWRMALNCVTNKVIVAGGGTTSPTLNIAEVDISTGVLINALSMSGSHEDMAGLCIDETGKSYLCGGISNDIFFADSVNNVLANVPNGYNLSEIGVGGTPSYYTYYLANGYNMMTMGGASFVFTSDGAVLKKWDRNTYALLGSVTIPGGQQNLGGGILADKCNNVFVGASNGVYRFDFNLVQKEYKATTAAVFDIAYASNSDIVASGDGFVTPLPFGRESCGGIPTLITSHPCDPAINTVKVRPAPGQGLPPYTFLWDDGNTDSIRTNLSLGDHIVTVRDGSCNHSFFTDTVTISNDTKALTIQKKNPLCNLSNDGEITITLISNQDITNITWVPTVNTVLLNDSTSKAGNLTSGTYTCHVSSNLGCSFDTIVTLTAPPLLQDSIKGWNAQCPADADGWAMVYPYGGVTPYTYAWNTVPPQTTQNSISLAVGQYIVTVSDSNSCKKNDTILIGSNPNPVAAFTVPPVCFGDTTVFTNTSTVSSGNYNSVWLFGFNNDSATTANTNYFYPVCNNYNATLTVISDSGCTATLTKPIIVSCMPTAAFTASDTVGCEPLCTTFQNYPLLSAGTNVLWSWTLGDGSPVNTSQNFAHCYTNDSVVAPVSYSVSLTVTSDSGCSATETKNNYITVYPNPIANFTADPSTAVITAPLISFTNLSAGATILNWDFGDSTSSLLYNPPAHTYSDTGVYTISLITSTLYGCIDATNQTITIDPDFTFYIPNVFSPNGDNINDTFIGKGTFIKEYEMRIYDRWGNMIYYTNEIDKPWDGKANDGKEAAQQDVYVYVVQVTDLKNKKHNYKGIVTLIK